MSVPSALSALLLTAYLILGGLGLGVGLLLPLVARGRDRDAVLSIGGRPWADGGVLVLVAFALVVAGLPGSLAALRALWPPLVLMLVALALRAAAAALRPHVLRQDLVDLGFGLASLLAAACLGLALGWFVDGLGADLSPRHAGPFGALSIWGILCAVGVVALCALLGSGWAIWSGRGAVRVFGREVGRAAALLFASTTVLCGLWAVPTGVAAAVFAGGWASGIAALLLALCGLALLAPFRLSLWGRHPAGPFACSVLAAACCIAAFAIAAFADIAEGRSGLYASYIVLVLLIGSPLTASSLWHRRSAIGRSAASDGSMTQAGRRSGSLANSLHLS